jgi:transcriptional regulator with XRE-family HTH domain
MVARATGQLRAVLATNLRQRRADLGLSQEALGDEAGVHRTFVGAVERGEVNISLDNIDKLATGLGLHAWQLLKAD